MIRSVDFAVERITRQGHTVRILPSQYPLRFEVDNSLVVSVQELLELGEGVYSVDELWELVLLRRSESSGGFDF